MTLFHRSSSHGEGSLKPPRRRDQLLGLFSRSRSPSPSPSQSPANNAQVFSANPSLPPTSNGDRGQRESAPHNVTPNDPKEPQALEEGPAGLVIATTDFANDDDLGLPESAYQRALASFSEEQRNKLNEQKTIRALFQQLNQADQHHREQSLLLKGMKAVHPYLVGLNATIDFVSPFASLEPAAGTALGLVKGSVSIALAISGRFDDMTKDIAELLKRIPAIDRCSGIVKGDGRLPEIYHALVDMYTDLLRFYLRTVTLFEQSRFVLRVALEMLKPEIAGIVSDFRSHAGLLSTLLEAESFAAIQETKVGVQEIKVGLQEEKVETLIRTTLEGNREDKFYNELRRRTDNACTWLTSSALFAHWLWNSGANLLALFGDMGCGKTLTTAFVADTLANQGRALCAYYCKDEHEAAKLGNIYRSILLQFLHQQPELKLRFWTWYQRTSQLVSGNPTRVDDKLRELLYDIISSSKNPVFVVLDALDECNTHPRKQLFSLFQDLFQSEKACLKVFISSRYNGDIEAGLPPGGTRIELRSSQERDRAIAAYLVSETDLPTEFHAKVVEELAARAHGSAIWLRLAVEYMVALDIANDLGLEMALDGLPSGGRLSELYGKLFSKICDGIQPRQTRLRDSLEILAVARRPLSLEELAYAVFIFNPLGKDAATLGELDRLAHSFDLFKLIRPFISATKGEGPKNKVRLVHQSLKELILTAPPAEWLSAAAMAKRKKDERAAELDANLLQRCIRYLLLDEFGERSLFPSSDHDAGPPSDFDPSDLGFGGFFAYAAAYWTSHFSDVSSEGRPDARQLSELCRKGSRRLENWVEQWRRPYCSYIPEHDYPEAMSSLDPLVVTAIFGPAASVTDLLRMGLDTSILTEDSAWTAVEHLIKRGDISTIKNLVQDKTLQSTLCCCKLLYTAIDAWRRSDTLRSDASSTREWEEIFSFLISHLRGDLLGCGNDMLRRAARSGCLTLIKQLFAAAEHDAALQLALVEPDDELIRGAGFLGQHQSIGEAAYEGHADVVRFLCGQPWLGSHLRYISQAGNMVFHQAVRRLNEEVLRTLIQNWPEGVDIRNGDHDTPLIVLIFGNVKREETVIKLARILMRQGKADATGRHDDEGFGPLCTAVRGGYTKLLGVLVREGGADIWEVVGVDDKTGRPFLRKGMDTWEDEKLPQQMLKALCSLLPLAVSIEYLEGAFVG